MKEYRLFWKKKILSGNFFRIRNTKKPSEFENKTYQSDCMTNQDESSLSIRRTILVGDSGDDFRTKWEFAGLPYFRTHCWPIRTNCCDSNRAPPETVKVRTNLVQHFWSDFSKNQLLVWTKCSTKFSPNLTF